ncbi:MAG: damage-control phosphatase ARMT1 family protein [Candidatus Bathyarchaeales archaeon]
MEIECAPCIIYRGHAEICEATKDKALRFKSMKALFDFLEKEFNQNAVPAYLGTERDRLVRKTTRNPDPYAVRKRLSNQKALEMLPLAEKIINNSHSDEERFRKALLCSIVGNVMEFDIPVHSFKFDDLEKLIKQSEKDLAIDEISRIHELAKKAKNVLYLVDNAGEIAFDTLFVKELKRHHAKVVVAVKSKPVLNDAMLEDAKLVGMDKTADKIITTGNDSVGLNLKESSLEFLQYYNSADLIIAKGMGYAETLTENKLTRPHALLLRTKCNPVARFFGVPREKNVAKILP